MRWSQEVRVCRYTYLRDPHLAPTQLQHAHVGMALPLAVAQRASNYNVRASVSTAQLSVVHSHLR